MKLSRSCLGFASLSLIALAGCPVTSDALCDKGTCESAIDATTPEGGDSGADGPVVAPRDPCVDKPTAPECVTNDSALFVSKSAAPNGDGTLAKPFATVSAALAKVTAEKKRVYVCEGTYEEQVAIGGVPATLIGGLACDFRTTGAKPTIKPTSGVALGIAKVGGASVIDMKVEATSDANASGSSAIGVFVTESTDILLRGVEIVAGAGQPGADGADASPTANHPDLQAPVGVTGGNTGAAGMANTCTACVDGTKSIAGNGGGYSPKTDPTNGDAMPKVQNQIANGGSSGPTCGPGTAGLPGNAGAKAAGGTVPATLAAKSWNDRTKTAVDGKNGGPGQGGGGGGVLTSGSGGGGSGACGGCGGKGGGAGGDGGSSIGVLVYQSTKIVVEKSTITTAAGGKGGNGGKGQKGQEAPGDGALGGGGGACKGGAGGHGAGGGGGGGGVGGYSAAIAYLGEAPSAPETTLMPGAAGEAGTGGTGGAPGGAGGSKGEDGANGAASKAGATLNLASN
jgi:hypothetical protein